ncbi:hypothetical protein K8S17_00635, partial [bacterium]|nr:hypothetical protein [bacterium]
MRMANSLSRPLVNGSRTIGSMMLVLVTLAVLMAVASTAIAATAIMPLGDSITDGAAGSTDNTGYRRPLFLQLEAGGYDVDFVGSLIGGIPTDFDRDHEGHGGWHANQIRDNIYNWLVSTPADIVILHIGTNDVSGGDEHVDEVEDILDNIDQYETDYSATV